MPMASTETPVEYLCEMQAQGYAAIRQIGAGHWIALHRYAFTVAIVKGRMFDRDELSDRWCYSEAATAVAAYVKWDGVTGEPEGWIKHPASGRCRYDGDPEREVLDWALEGSRE